MVIHLITRLPIGGATQLDYDITQRMHTSGQGVLILTGISDEKRSSSAKNNRILEAVQAANIPVEVCTYLHRVSPVNDLRATLASSRAPRAETRHRSYP